MDNIDQLERLIFKNGDANEDLVHNDSKYEYDYK